MAPGMEKVRSLVTGPIFPTPGAVMNAAQFLAGEIGDLLVLDVFAHPRGRCNTAHGSATAITFVPPPFDKTLTLRSATVRF